MIVPIDTGSLGDCLCYTPIFKYRNGVAVFKESLKARKVFAPLFKGIADVEFVEDLPQSLEESPPSQCISRYLLRQHGVIDENANSIPKIKLEEEEIKSAEEFLSQFDNPIAFNPYQGKHLTTTHPLGRYRSLSDLQIANIVNNHCGDILQFGMSGETPKVDGCIHLFDLPIRTLASYYKFISRYVGADTGDYHLMLSVGGMANVIVPKDNWNYSYIKHHYKKEDWFGELIRLKYYYD